MGRGSRVSHTLASVGRRCVSSGFCGVKGPKRGSLRAGLACRGQDPSPPPDCQQGVRHHGDGQEGKGRLGSGAGAAGRACALRSDKSDAQAEHRQAERAMGRLVTYRTGLSGGLSPSELFLEMGRGFNPTRPTPARIIPPSYTSFPHPKNQLRRHPC